MREFYRQNHRHQTYDFVRTKKREFLPFNRRRMSIFEALDYLNTLVDDSDPDIDLSQLQHLLQTSEAIRAAGHPDWFVLTGLIHDLGKVLCLFGEPQWAVVGDTFPVAARSAIASCTANSSPRIRMPPIRGSIRPRAFIARDAACGTWSCRGGMTSTCTSG